MGRPWSKGDALLASDLDAAFDDVEAKAVSAQNVAITAQDTANAALPLAGGTMVGNLTLANDPTDDLHAATKHYVDNHSGGAFVPLAGGTMSGPLVLSADPSALLGAATKQYVDIASARSFIDVTKAPYSAKGDGVTDDSAALQAALNACAATGGGIVYAPPTGKPYAYNVGLSVPAGVTLMGAGSRNFAGVTATMAQWAAFGTWLQPKDMVNPGVTLSGHGSAIQGINFIYAQPVPGATFSPTIYPWAISCPTSWTLIENIMVIGGSHGLLIEYTTESGGGTGVNVRNLMLACFVRGLRTNRANDFICFDNIQIRNLYYASTTSVVNYLYANLVGWECGYADNFLIKGLQFFQCKYGFSFFDDTCLGATHSAWNWNVVDVQHFGATFMAVANSQTHVSGLWSNIQAQSDVFPGEVRTETLFLLGSGNVDLSFSNFYLFANAAGVTLGDGVGGRLAVDGMKVLGYSATVAGQSLFTVNANATLTIGSRVITKPSGAGFTFAGAGVGEISTPHNMVWQVLPGALASNVSGSGAAQFISGANQFNPVAGGKYQAKISGVLTVVTPQAGGSASISLSGFPEIAASSISCASAGAVGFDSNWLEISSPSNVLGAIEVIATSGVVYNFSALTVQLR